MTAYPLPSFPGQTQQGLLNQLLRKKVEPGVEDWLDRGRNTAQSTFGARNDALTADDLREVWGWAPPFANGEAWKQRFGGDFTLAEREMGVKNVVTGLQRKLDDSVDESSEADEDEDAIDEDEEDADEMQVVGVRRKSHAPGVEFDISKESEHTPSKAISPAMPLEDISRFMMTGTMPGAGPGA